MSKAVDLRSCPKLWVAGDSTLLRVDGSASAVTSYGYRSCDSFNTGYAGAMRGGTAWGVSTTNICTHMFILFHSDCGVLSCQVIPDTDDEEEEQAAANPARLTPDVRVQHARPAPNVGVQRNAIKVEPPPLEEWEEDWDDDDDAAPARRPPPAAKRRPPALRRRSAETSAPPARPAPPCGLVTPAVGLGTVRPAVSPADAAPSASDAAAPPSLQAHPGVEQGRQRLPQNKAAPEVGPEQLRNLLGSESNPFHYQG